MAPTELPKTELVYKPTGQPTEVGKSIEKALIAPLMRSIPFQEIRKLMAGLCVTLGLPIMLPEEAGIVEGYIRKEMGQFTSEEIILAFNLYIQGKLDIAVTQSYTLNPAMMEKVMQSYRRLKVDYQPKEVVMDIKSMKNKQEKIDKEVRHGLEKLITRFKRYGNKMDDPSWSFWHDYLTREGQLFPVEGEDREILIGTARRLWLERLEAKMAHNNVTDARRINNLIKKVVNGEADEEERVVLPHICKEIKVKRWLAAFVRGEIDYDVLKES